jgi:hypothetical protein
MAEFPDANSGGLDPQAGGLDPGGAPGPKCKPPLWKRVRAWTILLLLYATFLGMAAAAIPLLRSVFNRGLAPDDRLMHLLWAAMLLAPAGFVVRYFVRVRLKTGRWRGTPEQRQQEKMQRVAKCSVDGAKSGCAANRNSLILFAIKWSSYAAFAPECPPWQRVAGWLGLAAYVLTLLALTAFGAICMGAGLSTLGTGGLLITGLGLACFIWPIVAVRSLIQGILKGKVGATREDLDELRSQRTAWRVRENRKPLRTKIISTLFLIVLYGLWWVRVTFHHAQHPHESWITPAMWTPALIYSVWIQWRRPKSAPPADDQGGGPEMRAQG